MKKKLELRRRSIADLSPSGLSQAAGADYQGPGTNDGRSRCICGSEGYCEPTRDNPDLTGCDTLAYHTCGCPEPTTPVTCGDSCGGTCSPSCPHTCAATCFQSCPATCNNMGC